MRIGNFAFTKQNVLGIKWGAKATPPQVPPKDTQPAAGQRPGQSPASERNLEHMRPATPTTGGSGFSSSSHTPSPASASPLAHPPAGSRTLYDLDTGGGSYAHVKGTDPNRLLRHPDGNTYYITSSETFQGPRPGQRPNPSPAPDTSNIPSPGPNRVPTNYGSDTKKMDLRLDTDVPKDVTYMGDQKFRVKDGVYEYIPRAQGKVNLRPDGLPPGAMPPRI